MRRGQRLAYHEADRHGLSYVGRDTQPSMFQIMTWHPDKNPLSDNEWLQNMNKTQQGRFTEVHKYQRSQQKAEGASPKAKLEGKEDRASKSKSPHGRQIKKELYYYGQQPGKASQKEKKGKAAQKKVAYKREVKRLNPYDVEERREIEVRKHNIKDFKVWTRQLPDSSFTTYYGKPAFAHYGSADKAPISRHKSHNVMPHAGSNHPQYVQSHEGALKKANVINAESRVPRNPKQEGPVGAEPRLNVSEYYNVEIVRPDLVNEERFSVGHSKECFKARTPRHNELNKVPERRYPAPVVHERPKKQRRCRTEQKEERLAFMSRPQKYMKEVREKQKEHSRLAYKVTECYPLDYNFETRASEAGARDEKWRRTPAAGVSSRSLNTRQQFYS